MSVVLLYYGNEELIDMLTQFLQFVKNAARQLNWLLCIVCRTDPTGSFSLCNRFCDFVVILQ